MQLVETDDEDDEETMGDAFRLSSLMFFISTQDCSWCSFFKNL